MRTIRLAAPITRLIAACCLLLLPLLGVVAAPAAPARADTSTIPTQFIAKLYTEALGRAPDPAGWASWTGYFADNGCSLSTLQYVATQFYTTTDSGGEFTSLPYDNYERVLALYRGLLSREPDSYGEYRWAGFLNDGTYTWDQVVAMVLGSGEFTADAATICATPAANVDPGYGWAGTAGPTGYPAITLPTTSLNSYDFTGTTGADLQTALNAEASTCGTVYLAQKVLVELTTSLTIPACVTLTTDGAPPPNDYAMMGRLVRAPDSPGDFTGAAVYLDSGAKLLNVWVDGQFDSSNSFNHDDFNIRMNGGDGTTVSLDKVSDTAGGSNIVDAGSYQITEPGSPESYACDVTNEITYNVITAYQSNHTAYAATSDGISNNCENTNIQYNAIVDATDVGIINFGNGETPQISTVENNTIISAGNSASAALCEEQYTDGTNSFAGSSITDNTFWTGPYTHFTIGMCLGVREWGDLNDSSGGSMTDNTTPPGLSANVQTGIAVTGMTDVTVTGNTPVFNLISGLPGGTTGNCPLALVAATLTAGTASGTIQELDGQPIDDPPTSPYMDNCMNGND